MLAIQGDYASHAAALEEVGAEPVLVRKPDQLAGLEGLIIPGGESTTFLKFLERDGFLESLRAFVAATPTFGTCAGCILLAAKVLHPPQDSLGVLDATVERNAYGRQIDSSIREGKFVSNLNHHLKGQAASDAPLEMVFIRAPKIVHVGDGVEVLATEGSDPVAVRQGRTMAVTFHPELSDDTRVHQAFLYLIANGKL